MATYDASAVVTLAIERIQPMIERHVIANQPFLSKIEKESAMRPKKYEFHDSHFIMPNTIAYPAAARAVAESGTLPTAQNSTFVNMSASLIKTVGISEITKERIVTGNEKAYIKSIPDKVRRDLLKGIKDSFEVALMGYRAAANGCIAKVLTAASGTTIVVYSHGGTNPEPSEPGTLWMRKGMPIRITASDGSTGAENRIIASISDHETFVISGGSATTADGDIVMPGDANSAQYGEQATGLWEHLDDASVNYQGISRGNYDELQANVLDNSDTPRLLTDELIEAALDATLESTYENSKADCIIMTPKMRRQYNALYADQRRATFGESMKGSSPKDALMPDEIKPMASPYCPRGRIMGVNSASFTLVYAGTMFEFEKVGGNYLLLLGTNATKYIYEVRNTTIWQLACDTPRLNWIIKDIIETPPS